MDLFFGMGVPGANPNDPSFFLRLPHLWPMFVIPIVCFYTFLGVWVVRKVREAMASESHAAGTGPSDGSTRVAKRCEPIGIDRNASEPGPETGFFEFRFFASTS
jgi:hypothetical protein